MEPSLQYEDYLAQMVESYKQRDPLKYQESQLEGERVMEEFTSLERTGFKQNVDVFDLDRRFHVIKSFLACGGDVDDLREDEVLVLSTLCGSNWREKINYGS